MYKDLIKKGIIFTLVILIALTSLFPMAGSLHVNKSTNAQEYWGLIFAVGKYLNHPDQDRPTMLVAAEELYDVLLNSPDWSSDHIHKIKGEAGTFQRLIDELNWLRENSDSNDYVVVYITTHGYFINYNGMPLDFPPKDEADGADEILIMYDGFENWNGFIWDDLLNFYLSRIKAKGICLIIDSCHAGGFDDPPYNNYYARFKNFKEESFSKGFANELSSGDRIILMSCEEDEDCYGSLFSMYFIDGLWGAADLSGNKDGIVSAEEGFGYSDYWINFYWTFDPTILDLYSGEFPLTYR